MQVQANIADRREYSLPADAMIEYRPAGSVNRADTTVMLTYRGLVRFYYLSEQQSLVNLPRVCRH